MYGTEFTFLHVLIKFSLDYQGDIRFKNNHQGPNILMYITLELLQTNLNYVYLSYNHHA